MTLREEMIQNAMAHNNSLTRDYLMRRQMYELLALCHPLEREYFKYRYNKGEL